MPGPQPKYQPSFTVEEVAQARKIARQLKAPSAYVWRARMVLSLSEHPSITQEALTREAGTHPNIVKKWRKRWATQDFSLEDRLRSGRPPVLPS